MDAATQFIGQLANDVLAWVGFGTIIGLLAKGVMPGRDPGGALANLAMGIGGTIIGCGIFSFFIEGRVTPISPGGACVALGGALTLLFFYRLLAGYFFTEGETSLKIHQSNRARRQRSHRRAA